MFPISSVKISIGVSTAVGPFTDERKTHPFIWVSKIYEVSSKITNIY